MPIAEAHPSAEELAAFALGTLDDEAQASIEAHVAACTSCQERAAVAPDDSFVELVRRVDARADRGAETCVEAAAQVETPTPPAAVAKTEGLAPAVALCLSAESGRPEIPDAIPPELARHERYRIVRLLGTGGMGAVYLAEHRVMHKLVALKVIKRAYTANPNALERFRGEVENAARLSHPNIVTTHDAEDTGETHFLVMEYVEGTDLGRLVQEHGRRPVDRACEYLRQAALGLQHAYEKDMVHRDLKPHNLMLTPDGRVKILDFGLARFASETVDAAGLTSTGIVLGTVDYIAPEQADNAHQADIRSDIYSLGCTLYHLLAGQPPFPTGTPIQKVMAHREKKPQPLTELHPDLPEGLMPVLERMMAKDPKQRYQTPAEVALALEQFLRATALPPAPKPGPRARTTDSGCTVILDKPPIRERRRPRFVIAKAILAFLVAGLLGVAIYRIATDKGELVITTESDDVKVVVTQGGKLVEVIDTKADKQIRLALRSGEYELELEGAPKGLKLNIEKATLARGQTVLATITWGGKPPDGVVAWWRAEGNAKDSVGNNDGTLKGGVKFSPGVAGQAFDFNGIDGQINLGNARSLHLSSGDFSVSAWVNFRSLKHPPGYRDDELPGDMAIAYKMGPAGTNLDGWSLVKQDDNRFWFGLGGGNKNGLGGDAGPTMIRSTTSVVPGVWYHVVAVKTAAHFSLYVNGIQEASKPLPAFKDTNTTDLLIGAAAGNHIHMAGLIDEVTVYNRALSQAEIKAHYIALAPPTKPGAKESRVYLYDLKETEWSVLDSSSSKDATIAIAVNGIKFSKGLWLHPPARGCSLAKYRLSGLGAETFVTKVAINDSALPTLPTLLTFQVLGDGKVLWTSVPTAKRGQMQECRISVKDVSVLELRVDCPGWNGWAHAVWLDPYLLLSSPRNTAMVGEIRRFEGHTNGAWGVAFSPDGRHALSGAGDGTVRLWEVATGREVRRFSGHNGAVRGIAFSPDGRQALTASYDGTVRLWDVQTGKEIRVLKGHAGVVRKVVFSPDSRRALSGGDMHTMRLWDLESGRELRRFKGGDGVAFSPEGRRALSGGDFGYAGLWDVETGAGLKQLLGHRGWVTDVVFLPGGRQALSCGNDQTLRLWDLDTGAEIRVFSGHTAGGLGVAITQDGRYALSSSDDKTVRLWDLQTGKELHCFTGHTEDVKGVAISPDGKFGLSGSLDGTMRLWRLPDPPPAKENP
jgi:hypothetical protein